MDVERPSLSEWRAASYISPLLVVFILLVNQRLVIILNFMQITKQYLRIVKMDDKRICDLVIVHTPFFCSKS